MNYVACKFPLFCSANIYARYLILCGQISIDNFTKDIDVDIRAQTSAQIGRRGEGATRHKAELCPGKFNELFFKYSDIISYNLKGSMEGFLDLLTRSK